MSRLLETIASSEDVRGLTLAQLEQLAGELREAIITTTARTGGHIGASLGAVEIILALHTVYRTPRDKVVFDIGHQAYAHKLLTGRREQFGSIRQLDGLSGFLKRRESPYDVWEAGHASTSLSAALGMAVARDMRQETHQVAALIGDGALTAGMAWEALNHIGHLKTRMVVVVNDNSMSIAANVGAFSRYLTGLRSAPGYTRLKQDIEALLEAVPVLGAPLIRTAEKVKDLARHAVVPGNVFEELGFKYFGPVRGHDLGDLIPVLAHAREFEGPVVVHVITQKGKGYRPAEERPMQFHGPGPFEVDSGRFIKKAGPPSYSQVFSETLVELAEKREDIVAVTAAMPDGTKLELFGDRFPGRLYDVGIAEQHAVTFAAGLAAAGMRPVFAVYSTFLQRGYDQLVHDVCHQQLPVLFGIDRAGLVGSDGATHQGVFDLAFLRPIPNLEIAMGKDERELRNLVTAALERPGAVAIRYPRGQGRGLDLSGPPDPIEWGRGEWIHQGRDLTLVALGPMTYTALAARTELEQLGYRVGVVNARFVKPLDTALLAEVAASSGALMTLEEHVVAGGFGAAVLEWASQEGVSLPIRTEGLPDEFIDHGPVPHFLEHYGLTADAIVRKAKSWLGPVKRRA
ncbi:MAG: 1-deoxy-D-xylulose-5-phosphate synthase [Thermaerobacter sp.]|nr:1-deoxy-D-xylulose-5-phosphate synthase [Thermaerobacter sp.]